MKMVRTELRKCAEDKKRTRIIEVGKKIKIKKLMREERNEKNLCDEVEEE